MWATATKPCWHSVILIGQEITKVFKTHIGAWTPRAVHWFPVLWNYWNASDYDDFKPMYPNVLLLKHLLKRPIQLLLDSIYCNHSIYQTPNLNKNQNKYPPSHNHGSGKWVPPIISFLWFRVVFHFHEYWRKGNLCFETRFSCAPLQPFELQHVGSSPLQTRQWGRAKELMTTSEVQLLQTFAPGVLRDITGFSKNATTMSLFTFYLQISGCFCWIIFTEAEHPEMRWCLGFFCWIFLVCLRSSTKTYIKLIKT